MATCFFFLVRLPDSKQTEYLLSRLSICRSSDGLHFKTFPDGHVWGCLSFNFSHVSFHSSWSAGRYVNFLCVSQQFGSSSNRKQDFESPSRVTETLRSCSLSKRGETQWTCHIMAVIGVEHWQIWLKGGAGLPIIIPLYRVRCTLTYS